MVSKNTMNEILKKLKLNPKNPRTIGPDELEGLKKKIRSLPEMLEWRPLIYDEKFIVLAGNQRLKALREMEKEGFEIKDSYFRSVSKLTEKKRKQLIITDNLSDGGWAYDMLVDEYGDMPLEEWGIDRTHLDLERVNEVEIDADRLFVLTVEAPEAPKLKERMAFYCESIEDYKKISAFFKEGRSNLNVKKLLDMIQQ